MDEFEWGCNSNKCDENQSGERCADLVCACDDRRIRKREIFRNESRYRMQQRILRAKDWIEDANALPNALEF